MAFGDTPTRNQDGNTMTANETQMQAVQQLLSAFELDKNKSYELTITDGQVKIWHEATHSHETAPAPTQTYTAQAGWSGGHSDA